MHRLIAYVIWSLLKTWYSHVASLSAILDFYLYLFTSSFLGIDYSTVLHFQENFLEIGVEFISMQLF